MTSSVSVVAQTTKGTIIRIEVRGEWPDGHGNELAELVAAALVAHDPHACVIDLCETKGPLRADTLGGLLLVLARKREGVTRPACIVAGGNIARGVRWFLGAARASRFSDVALFADIESALDHLRRREDPATA